MTYLVDANVLSEPTKSRPNVKVEKWLEENESALVVDPIILGEVRIGILRLPAGRKRKALEQWFSEVVSGIVCIPWDAGISMHWAKLVVDLQRAGRSMPLTDSMIAATAITHGLTVATRNGRDFQQAGLLIINPFE